MVHHSISTWTLRRSQAWRGAAHLLAGQTAGLHPPVDLPRRVELLPGLGPHHDLAILSRKLDPLVRAVPPCVARRGVVA